MARSRRDWASNPPHLANVTDARLALGIVGCGAVVERYHLPAVLGSERVQLRAVADPSPERAHAVAGTSGATVVTSHHELIPLVDAAIVAVPNHLHATVALELVRAGVHVLVEKPLAPTSAECSEIVRAAEEADVTLAVGLDFRFAPAIRFVQAVLQQRLLGDVRSFDLRHGTEARWPLASSYLFDRERAGGGVWLDHGAHLLDHLLWWLGPCSVASYRDDARGGVEADAIAELETADGARGTVELSRTRTLRNTCVLQGEAGSIEVSLFEPYAEVSLRVDNATEALAGSVGSGDFARQPYLAVFEEQLADFVAASTERRPPFVPGTEGARSIALIEECYAVRQPLELPWDFPQAYEAVR